MIPNLTTREVRQSAEVTDVGGFGISHRDSAHIKRILRSQLYSDKITAVLREYGSNAWDANREAGRGDEPIEVVLPTMASPTLIIRDRGSGLSPADVDTVYRWYGVSTKRDSNMAVGCLGLGSKAGFAYSDSFTIVSRHGGRCRTYVACLDAGDVDYIKLLSDVESDSAQSGVEIHIAVRPADVGEFRSKAFNVFRWFQPQPRIDIELPPNATPTHPQGCLTGDKWYAVMGCIGYPVDLGQLRDVNFAKKFGGVLYFGIGELSIAASRETLEYTDATRHRLERAVNDLVDAEAQALLRRLDGETSLWRRRLAAQSLRSMSGLAQFKSLEKLFSSRVDVKWPCKARSLQWSVPSAKDTIQVSGGDVIVDERARIVLVDVSRMLSRFPLTKYDIILLDGTAPTWQRRGVPQSEIDAAYSRLMTAIRPTIAAHGLEDVPVVRLSQLPYAAPPKRVRAARSTVSEAVKHKKTAMLRLRTDVAHESPFSKCWESVEREASPTDVTVAVDRFCNDNFFEMYRRDADTAEFFGVEMPAVFAWRRVEGQTQPGVDYEKWRASLRDIVVAKSTVARQMIDDRAWSGASPAFDLADAAAAERRLGVAHPVAVIMRRAADAASRRRLLSWRVEQAVAQLCRPADSDAIRADVAAVKAAYPLLRHGGFDRLDITDDREAWLDYIADVDAKRTQTIKETP